MARLVLQPASRVALLKPLISADDLTSADMPGELPRSRLAAPADRPFRPHRESVRTRSSAPPASRRPPVFARGVPALGRLPTTSGFRSRADRRHLAVIVRIGPASRAERAERRPPRPPRARRHVVAPAPSRPGREGSPPQPVRIGDFSPCRLPVRRRSTRLRPRRFVEGDGVPLGGATTGFRVAPDGDTTRLPASQEDVPGEQREQRDRTDQPAPGRILPKKAIGPERPDHRETAAASTITTTASSPEQLSLRRCAAPQGFRGDAVARGPSRRSGRRSPARGR